MRYALTLQHFNLPQLHHDVFGLLSLLSYPLVLQSAGQNS
jgi:hypothetical protein